MRVGVGGGVPQKCHVQWEKEEEPTAAVPATFYNRLKISGPFQVTLVTIDL